jgi:hypothetical protein
MNLTGGLPLPCEFCPISGPMAERGWVVNFSTLKHLYYNWKKMMRLNQARLMATGLKNGGSRFYSSGSEVLKIGMLFVGTMSH